jgi:hypothetical protein
VPWTRPNSDIEDAKSPNLTSLKKWKRKLLHTYLLFTQTCIASMLSSRNLCYNHHHLSVLVDRTIHACIHTYHIYFHCYNYIIGLPAYIIPGLDVDSSLAKQTHHLGVTLSSGYDKRSESTLDETRKRHKRLYVWITTQQCSVFLILGFSEL